MSSKRYSRAIVLFRRDLRLYDHTALRLAVNHAQEIVPVFIIDPRQVGVANEYRSMNAIQFMHESLADLQGQLAEQDCRLYVFTGRADEVLAALFAHNQIDAVFTHVDYTPFARERDEQLAQVCSGAGVAWHAEHDTLLTIPGTVMTKTGTYFQVFTPFWRAASQVTVAQPHALSLIHGYKYVRLMDQYIYDVAQAPALAGYANHDLAVRGGRTEGLALLKRARRLTEYEVERDMPAVEYTSQLSAHLKFGTLSVREVYHALQGIPSLVRQLYWRDFYTHIAYHVPRVFGHAYRSEYDRLSWSRAHKAFERWCAGMTGFPIVDAGMRQLNATGFMHNRVRMIVGSFLVKDLWIDWRWGERYFAQQLVDYDPAVNNGNWQWVASTGCDPQPYFRIFNPWTQQQKFDPDAQYIKQWVPELRAVSVENIHRWAQVAQDYGDLYPAPMVDHAQAAALAKERFKNA